MELSSLAADGPLTPEQALASFKLEPGLRVELVAAEPLIGDPVAIAWDERGRMFVAENRGYPTGPGEGRPPVGIIAMLEDTDGDGRYEKRTVFADNLTFPNGVMPWRGGLFVTCAPDLLYLKDTDGDGRADVRRVILTGFSTNGSTQLRVSHPTLRLDGWVYLTSGLTGSSKIKSPEHSEWPVLETTADVRFRPDTGEVEIADGRGQFGLTFDDFGRRFVCMNRIQVQHVVMSSRYLKRNPHLAFSETMQNCPELTRNPFMRGEGAAARLFPVSANLTTADSHAGFFTAACGVTIYRGMALPSEYRGCAFSCDPTGNLVHYDRLEPNGASFVAKRVRDGIEVLASTDNWFRPVFLANGPDGALYVCDMYRKTIEHPEYLSVEVRKRTDFDSGRGMGRIWKVGRASSLSSASPQGAKKETNRGRGQAGSLPYFTNPSVRELVAALDSPSGWQRDTAFRLLFERQDKAAVPLAKAALRKSSSAGGAVATLHVLQAMNSLDDSTLERALRSAEAPVRENAIQLAEPRLSRSASLLSRVIALHNDADARVRFQCALSLGAVTDPRTVSSLARIAAYDADDRWSRAAVLSSVAGREKDFLATLLGSQSVQSSQGTLLLFSEAARLLGASQPPSELAASLQLLGTESTTKDFAVRAALLTGFANSLRSRGVDGSGDSALLRLIARKEIEAAVRDAVEALFSRARELALDAQRSMPVRLGAVTLLAHANRDRAGDALVSLIDPREPTELVVGAVRALGEFNSEDVARVLLSPARWKGYTPAMREAVLSTALSRPQHLNGLLAAIEAGELPAGAVDSARRNQLMKHRDELIRARAEKLFKQTGSGDRMKAYEEFKSALNLKPVPGNGREIFKRLCANCHRFEREGIAVGPDLFDIRNQPKESILLHIIIPEFEIAPNSTAYVIETKDGRTVTGLLAGETAASVTLRQALGIEETFLRSNIVSMSASSVSLMPQELEKGMSRQEMADLLAYLKGEAD